jgi:hypothetical protein
MVHDRGARAERRLNGPLITGAAFVAHVAEQIDERRDAEPRKIRDPGIAA